MNLGILFTIWELKKIALRNLARHKTKTILTSAAIMVSVAIYIFLNSWLGGMSIESRRNIVNFEMGSAKLQTTLYFDRKDEMPIYETFTDWEIYHEALSKEGYVSAPRFVFNGTLFSKSGSLPILFHGLVPELDKEVFRYASYVDFGRFVEEGKFEIALGTVAAERLRVGIPTRPFRKDLENLIEYIADDVNTAIFIRDMYEIAPTFRDIFSPDIVHEEGNERMLLKRNVSQENLDKYWDLIAATDRNDVRINAIIDIKAVPEFIRLYRWEDELLPKLNDEEMSLILTAYEYLDIMEAYVLVENNEEILNLILDIMLRAGYTGAIRHVNQLIDVVVVGVINSPAPLPNGNTAYIPLDVLQDESGMMLAGAVTELVIRERNVPDTRLPGLSESGMVISKALERGLNDKVPDYLGIRTWDEYMEDYLGYEALQTGAPQIIAVLLFILSFIGISNTILMAILERTKEIGMMRAMGMTDKQMVIVYMLEAGFLGFIGSVLGILFSIIINYPMVVTGLDLTAMADTLSGGIGFRTTGVFRSIWNIPLMFYTGIFATLLASFMAIVPTRRALKMQITESLRFD